MKKIFVAAIMAALFLMPQMSLADMTVSTGASFGPYHYSGGGEFTLKVNSGLEHLAGYVSGTTSNVPGYTDSFQSFCIEGNEYIYTNQTYFGEISYGATNGGQSGQTSPNFDPISVGTAYLYSEFIRGSLAGYTYSGSGRLESANYLQQAFWWLEGEKSQVYNKYNPFELMVYTKYGGEALAKANNTPFGYGVAALNIYQVDNTGKKIYAQSQLVGVPEPATMLLLGLGLIGLAGVRSRIKK